MSNKSQLQTNNTKVASLTEVLKTKGTPSGEEVTEETNAYTAKLETLETAIAALETELEGKASGGGGSASIETTTLSFVADGPCENFMDTISYMDKNGVAVYEDAFYFAGDTILVMKNSIFVTPLQLFGDVTMLYSSGLLNIYKITGECHCVCNV
jgi:hypothetical protein